MTLPEMHQLLHTRVVGLCEFMGGTFFHYTKWAIWKMRPLPKSRKSTCLLISSMKLRCSLIMCFRVLTKKSSTSTKRRINIICIHLSHLAPRREAHSISTLLPPHMLTWKMFNSKQSIQRLQNNRLTSTGTRVNTFPGCCASITWFASFCTSEHVVCHAFINKSLWNLSMWPSGERRSMNNQ